MFSVVEFLVSVEFQSKCSSTSQTCS